MPDRPGRDWPAPYMDGYWPSGGIGSQQSPVSSIGGGDRGRPPNAVGKGGTPGLTSRSGMISLDLPEGLIEPVPGGVDDHHVTICYLGGGVDDPAFAEACSRAQAAARLVPGPLVGILAGIDSFPPSGSSDGKVPAFIPARIPHANVLREALADLSASEFSQWSPHVTLTYLDPGAPLPDPGPPVPVTFTHLSVHRGGEVYRIALGSGEPESAPAVGKGAADLSDPNPVEALHVYNQLLGNYPPASIAWVKSVRWIGPVRIPTDRVNTADEGSWAASHQPHAVRRHMREIKAGASKPVIMVQKPGEAKAEVIDGHHRYLGYRSLGKPVVAYVGFVPRGEGPWDETHASQVHQGSSPANKGANAPVAAGIAVRAADTGRILMLQRAHDEDDPAGGFWEFPGGRLEDGEDAFVAGRREFQEETGCKLPEDGELTGLWNSGNGRYRGFVLTVANEDALPVFGDRDEVDNPDNPDGDYVEALAWWHPDQLRDNPAVRPELAEDLKRVRRALKSAATPALEATPHLLGPHGLWRTPSKKVPVKQKLPNYVEHIAAALMRDQGLDESTAISYAINAIKRWAKGDLDWGAHRKVTPEVVAASRRALAEWEQLRASHAQG